MTCSDVQRVLPELFDEAPDREFSTAFEDHVQACADCSDLLSDLRLIANEARQLAASEEPAPRVWAHIAAQLRQEGIIHEPQPEPIRRPVLVPSSTRHSRWSAWWLAPITACLLAAGAYVISHKPAPQVALQTQPAAVKVPSAATTAVIPTPNVPATTASAKNTVSVPPAQTSSQPAVDPAEGVESAANSEVGPRPSAEDQQFLSMVSTRAPSLRATYESQLQTVDADIREVQRYLARNPSDADARQELMDAYQKKSLLYQIALDRIQ